MPPSASSERLLRTVGRCAPAFSGAGVAEFFATAATGAAGAMPGMGLISTLWWAGAIISCHVMAGRDPPVILLVD